MSVFIPILCGFVVGVLIGWCLFCGSYLLRLVVLAVDEDWFQYIKKHMKERKENGKSQV